MHLCENRLLTPLQMTNVVAGATPDKSVLVRARKHKRAEVIELKAISEKRGFPTSSRLSMVTQVELQDDFALMGVRSSFFFVEI